MLALKGKIWYSKENEKGRDFLAFEEALESVFDIL